MKAIDISSNNHVNGELFNFLQVKDAGYEAVYVKATQGNNYLNPYLIGDVRDASNNGLEVGVYHFYDAANGTPEEQAAWFKKNGIYIPIDENHNLSQYLDLVPALDFETLNNLALVEQFIAALGEPCGLYTDRSIIMQEGSSGFTKTGAKFGWLAWPGWTNEPLPTGTAIVQTGQQPVQGIPAPVDIDEVLNPLIIATHVPEPTPQPLTEEEEDMPSTTKLDDGTLVTYWTDPKSGHLVELTRKAGTQGQPMTGEDVSLIDVNDAFPNFG